MVEGALRAADAAKIEAERREAAVHERIVELVDDGVVHRAAELRVRMQDDGDRRVLLPRRVVSAFNSAGRTGENHLWHGMYLFNFKTAFQTIALNGLSAALGNEQSFFRTVLIIWFSLVSAATMAISGRSASTRQTAASTTGARAKSKLFARPRDGVVLRY